MNNGSKDLTSKTLCLIDGSGFIFRAYYALPPLSAPDGAPVGAVYGMCQMLYKILQVHKFDFIAVVFDVARKTFRNDLYPQYKANRQALPDDLIPQFSIIRQAVQAFGLCVIEKEGYEADDLIASYVKVSTDQGLKTTILSSDKDLVQLLQENVFILDPMKNIPINEDYVQKKWNIHPSQMIDFQSMVGDSSDNVPGIKGIGPKTASTLLQKYASLQGIYDNLKDLKPNVQQKFIQDREQCHMSKQLVTLIQDVPLQKDVSQLVLKYSKDNVIEFANYYGFKQLVHRIESTQGHTEEKTILHGYRLDFSFSSQNIDEQMQEFFDIAQRTGIVSLYKPLLEDKSLLYLGFCTHEQQGKAILLDTKNSKHQAFVRRIFQEESILKLGINIKSILTACSVWDCYATDDLELAFFILQAGKNTVSIENIAQYVDVQIKTLIDKKSSPQEKQDNALWMLSFIYYSMPFVKKALIDQQLYVLYTFIERPLIPVLSCMEQWGMYMDKPSLQTFHQSIQKSITQLEQRIYEQLGKSKDHFNLASSLQLGQVLFDELKLQGDNKSLVSKTKGGGWSTDSSILEKFSQQYVVVRDILKYRQLTKLHSTYTKALLDFLDHKDIVHTTYVMTGAVTGRLATKAPNVQNIPIRSELGRKIRSFITARNADYILIGGDYNQIELRILAEIAHSDILRESFEAGEDIHSITAKKLFGDAREDHRRKAKMVNFGLMYGMSPYGLSQRLHIDVAEAKSYIKDYFYHFSDVLSYMNTQVALCEKQGYVTTLFGRKIFIPSILSKNYQIREHAKRQAINAPIQGSAADIIKNAMIELQRLLHKRKEFSTFAMILQIHDELVLDIPKIHSKAYLHALHDSMMHAVQSFHIPFTVKLGQGHTWEQVHNGELHNGEPHHEEPHNQEFHQRELPYGDPDVS